MPTLFVVPGIILLVADFVTLYRMRNEVNARILAPIERIPLFMFSPSYFRMLRLHRESYPASWLRRLNRIADIGFALCLIALIKSLK